MSAAPFIGRVAGITAALGMGVAVLQGTAVAAAEAEGVETSSRPSAASSGSDSAAAPSRTPEASGAGAGGAGASGSGVAGTGAKPSVPVRGRTAAVVRDRADVSDRASVGARRTPAVDAGSVASPAVSTLPARAATTMTLVAPSLTTAVAVPEQSAEIFSTTPPDPKATVDTPYGALGQWMINKEGQVADWVGLRFCGAGTTVANCGVGKPDEGKIMQEPINTIFVVQARNQYFAELKLNLALRLSGFGPSCCSSVGYSGIVGDSDYKQFPRGGPLGLGILPPLPFGLFQNGLLGLAAGLGPAYRDRSFLVANTHLRTFGGAPDGNGNYIFTASVSEENLDTTGGGLLPTHGFLNYNQARGQLLAGMLSKSWFKASDRGLIQMDNAIDPGNSDYTTSDYDGLAQVIALGSLFGMAPVRTTPVGAVGQTPPGPRWAQARLRV